jgi:hypothetical protein
MSRRREIEQVVEQGDQSLLEIVDQLIDHGVVLEGEVVLGLAGVDLIYLRLSAILCAADRVWSERR